MAIIRTKRTNNFTVIDNNVYADNRLSFQAMGLLSYLLSGQGKSVNIDELSKVTQGTSKHSREVDILNMISELIFFGFIGCERNEDGMETYFIIR